MDKTSETDGGFSFHLKLTKGRKETQFVSHTVLPEDNADLPPGQRNVQWQEHPYTNVTIVAKRSYADQQM